MEHLVTMKPAIIELEKVYAEVKENVKETNHFAEYIRTMNETEEESMPVEVEPEKIDHSQTTTNKAASDNDDMQIEL